MHLTYVHDDLYIAFLFSTSSSSDIYIISRLYVSVLVYMYFIKVFASNFRDLCMLCVCLILISIRRLFTATCCLHNKCVSELLAAAALETFYTLLVAFSAHILNCKLMPIHAPSCIRAVSMLCCCVYYYISDAFSAYLSRLLLIEHT